MLLFKLLTAGAGWMLSLTLMVVATIGRPELDVLRGWSILVALAAWIPTHSLILQHTHAQERAELDAKLMAERDELDRMLRAERVRTERLIQALALEFAEAELPRIGPEHSPSSC